MSILLLTIPVTCTALLLYIFFFWRRLKEDYISKAIFNAAFLTLIATLVFSQFARLTDHQNAWFWGGFVGFFMSVMFFARSYKFKIFELYEAAGRSALFLIIAIGLADYLSFQNIKSLAIAGFCIALFGLFIVVDANYRKFTWYRSGRVGVAGLIILGVFFTARAIVAALGFDILSILGRIDFIFSGIVAFLHFFFVYHLSQN